MDIGRNSAMGKFIATVAVIFLVYVAYVALTGDDDSSDSVGSDGCGTALCCPDCEIISVNRIVDGDTFVGDEGRVRLFGMDTPEVGEPCYSEATARLHELAKGAVRVEAEPRARDPFDRLLYYIYTESGESIDEMLVREGYARAWTRDGQHRGVLMDLERDAQENSVGCLW